jgi:hypothetical protein
VREGEGWGAAHTVVAREWSACYRDGPAWFSRLRELMGF